MAKNRKIRLSRRTASLTKLSHQVSLLGLLFFTVQSCGTKRSEAQNEAAKNRRAGRSVTTTGSASYSDTRPTISADGTKMGFISSRSGKLWAYKFTNAAGAVVAPLGSTTDLTQASDFITDFMVLPNGVSTVFKGSKGSTETLYLQDFAGLGAAVGFTTDTDKKLQMVSSADSKLVAFVRQSQKADGAPFYRVYVADLTNLASPQVSVVSGETLVESTPIFSFASTAPYQLITQQIQADGKGISLVSRTASTAAGFASATVSLLAKDQIISEGIGGILGTSSILTAKKLKLSEKFTPDLQIIRSLPTKIAITGGDPAVLTSPGTEVLSLGGSKTGDFSFWLMRNFFKDNGSQFGVSLVLRKESADSVSVIQPRTAAVAGKWELAADATAKTRDDGSAGELDYQIIRAQFSQDSTIDTYQVVYETLYGGDSDIRLLQVQSGKAEFIEVSSCSKTVECKK